MNIWYGTGENKHFSNLEYRPFFYKEKLYISVEQAYQSNKSGNFDRDTYNKFTGPGQKHIGHRAKTDGDWNIDLMVDLIYESFNQNLKYKLALVKTGNEIITHNQEKSVWKELFPKILMDLREEFKIEIEQCST